MKVSEIVQKMSDCVRIDSRVDMKFSAFVSMCPHLSASVRQMSSDFRVLSAQGQIVRVIFMICPCQVRNLVTMYREKEGNLWEKVRKWNSM